MSIEALTRLFNLSAESLDEGGFRAEFAAKSGIVAFPGSAEESELKALVSRYALSLSLDQIRELAQDPTQLPSALRAGFRGFLSDPANYSSVSTTHARVLVRSVTAEFRRLAEFIQTKIDSLGGRNAADQKRELLAFKLDALAIVRSMPATELQNRELNTLTDIARLAFSEDFGRIGLGMMHMISSSGGLNPGFQRYLAGLPAEVRTFDHAEWRMGLGKLEKIARRAGDTPRFQDIWLIAFARLPKTRMKPENLRLILYGPPTPEMLTIGNPQEFDATDARRRSIVVVLGDGEHKLAARFMTYLAARRAGLGLLDGIIHAAASRPLKNVSRELVLKAMAELEDLTNFRRADLRSALFLSARRIWHFIRPLLDKGEARAMATAASAEVYLKDYYGRKGKKGGGGGGNRGGKAPSQAGTRGSANPATPHPARSSGAQGSVTGVFDTEETSGGYHFDVCGFVAALYRTQRPYGHTQIAGARRAIQGVRTQLRPVLAAPVTSLRVATP